MNELIKIKEHLNKGKSIAELIKDWDIKKLQDGIKKEKEEYLKRHPGKEKNISRLFDGIINKLNKTNDKSNGEKQKEGSGKTENIQKPEEKTTETPKEGEKPVEAPTEEKPAETGTTPNTKEEKPSNKGESNQPNNSEPKTDDKQALSESGKTIKDHISEGYDGLKDVTKGFFNKEPGTKVTNEDGTIKEGKELNKEDVNGICEKNKKIY